MVRWVRLPQHKWYVHKAESIIENGIHEIFWDWETNGSYNLSLKANPCVNQQELKIISCRNFCCSARPQREHERKRKNRQILGSRQRTKKKLLNMVTVISTEVDVQGTIHKVLGKRLEELVIRRRIKTIVETG